MTVPPDIALHGTGLALRALPSHIALGAGERWPNGCVWPNSVVGE